MSLNDHEIREEIRRRVARFGSRLGNRPVVLFGSRAAGTNRPGSDYDIGIVGNEPVPVKAFYDLMESLENIRTLYRIELVDFAKCDERFRRNALKHTEVIRET